MPLDGYSLVDGVELVQVSNNLNSMRIEMLVWDGNSQKLQIVSFGLDDYCAEVADVWSPSETDVGNDYVVDASSSRFAAISRIFLFDGTAGKLYAMDGADGAWQVNEICSEQTAKGMRFLASGDFDGDGSGDVLFKATDGNLSVCLMDGNTVKTSGGVKSSPVNLGKGWELLDVRDLDLNGYDDLLLRKKSKSGKTDSLSGLNLEPLAKPLTGYALRATKKGEYKVNKLIPDSWMVAEEN